MNNDVVVTWTYLERLMRFLEDQADVGAASPLIVDSAGVRKRVGFDFPRTPWGSWLFDGCLATPPAKSGRVWHG